MTHRATACLVFLLALGLIAVALILANKGGINFPIVKSQPTSP